MMFEDFKDDCISTLGIEVFKIIEKIIENNNFEDFEDFEIYSHEITFSKEKIHALQENVCVNISSKDYEIEMLYENGIINGTQLNDYSFNSNISFKDSEREYEEIIGVEVDFEAMDLLGVKYSKDKAKILLDNNKSKILKLQKNKSYDNYVTGGGTNKTNDYYKTEIDKIKHSGLRWKYITKIHKLTANFH